MSHQLGGPHFQRQSPGQRWGSHSPACEPPVGSYPDRGSREQRPQEQATGTSKAAWESGKRGWCPVRGSEQDKGAPCSRNGGRWKRGGARPSSRCLCPWLTCTEGLWLSQVMKPAMLAEPFSTGSNRSVQSPQTGI